MTRLVLLTLLIVVSTLARAVEEADVERTVRQRAAREGLTDDAARDLTNAVRTITQTREWALLYQFENYMCGRACAMVRCSHYSYAVQ